MKPNPVKKMVEYCNVLGETKCDQFNYDSGGDAVCKKHKRGLSIERPNGAALGDRCLRPEWCTDETFVRVEIVPVMDGDVEYCTCCGERCNRVSVEDGEYHCGITNRYWIGNLKRPEACRKLEVE